jgi:hypothetical protein
VKWFHKKPTAGEYVADFEEADAAALQALQRGQADEETQKRALKWIIEKASGLYEEPYIKGCDGERDTNFNLGRACVGRQIVTLLNFSYMEIVKRKKR